MSIVVYRDGVMACDTSSFRAGVVSYNNGKIIKGPRTGCLYGFAGLYSVACKFKNWVQSGENGEFEEFADEVLEKYSDKDEFVCTVLIVHPSQQIDLWNPMGYDSDVTATGYEAIGGPYELAYGALYMGATAEEAVRACIHHSEYAQGDVVKLYL